MVRQIMKQFVLAGLVCVSLVKGFPTHADLDSEDRLLASAESYAKSANYSSAERMYKSYARVYPKGELKLRSYTGLLYIYSKMGRYSDGYEVAKRLVTEYPHTREAQQTNKVLHIWKNGKNNQVAPSPADKGNWRSRVTVKPVSTNTDNAKPPATQKGHSSLDEDIRELFQESEQHMSLMRAGRLSEAVAKERYFREWRPKIDALILRYIDELNNTELPVKNRQQLMNYRFKQQSDITSIYLHTGYYNATGKPVVEFEDLGMKQHISLMNQARQSLSLRTAERKSKTPPDSGKVIQEMIGVAWSPDAVDDVIQKYYGNVARQDLPKEVLLAKDQAYLSRDEYWAKLDEESEPKRKVRAIVQELSNFSSIEARQNYLVEKKYYGYYDVRYDNIKSLPPPIRKQLGMDLSVASEIVRYQFVCIVAVDCDEFTFELTIHKSQLENQAFTTKEISSIALIFFDEGFLWPLGIAAIDNPLHAFFSIGGTSVQGKVSPDFSLITEISGHVSTPYGGLVLSGPKSLIVTPIARLPRPMAGAWVRQ